jgi:transposase-like protein
MTTTAQRAPGRWKKEAEQNGQRAFPGQGHPQDEELARLRRENEVLRQEREILKKVSMNLGSPPPMKIGAVHANLHSRP